MLILHFDYAKILFLFLISLIRASHWFPMAENSTYDAEKTYSILYVVSILLSVVFIGLWFWITRLKEAEHAIFCVVNFLFIYELPLFLLILFSFPVSFFFSSHFFSCSSQVKVSKTCHCCLMWSSTWSTNVLIDGKKLPGCSSVGSVLSLHHINPLGKRCYLEHIISGDAYQKDKIQHQDAKSENELLDITEIKGKE